MKPVSEKSKEEDKVDADDEVENPDDSQFFNVASKVMKKLDSKPKKTADSTKNSSKVFKSPKAKLPLQTVVSRSVTKLQSWSSSKSS